MFLERQTYLKLIVFFAVFSLTNAISNALVSISTGAATIYIMYDCIHKKSLNGFVIPSLVGKSILFFLLSVLISSIAVWDIPSISLACKYIYWATPFVLLTYICAEREMKRTVLYAIIASILFASSYSIYQFTLSPVGIRIGGFYDNPNFFAVLLILTLPFLILFFIKCVKNNIRNVVTVITLLSIIFGIFALYLTGSRGAMLGFVLGGVALLLFYGIIKKQFAILILTLVIVIGSGLFVVSGKMIGGMTRSYDMERVYLLESSYNMWQNNKVIGVGLNNWKDEYQKKYILPQAKEHYLIIPHNTIAWFFSATGIVGGMGFLIFTFGILFFLLQMIKRYPDNFFLVAMLWSFVAFSIHGLVDVGITMKSSNRLFFALLGVTVASLNWSVQRNLKEAKDEI